MTTGLRATAGRSAASVASWGVVSAPRIGDEVAVGEPPRKGPAAWFYLVLLVAALAHTMDERGAAPSSASFAAEVPCARRHRALTAGRSPGPTA